MNSYIVFRLGVDDFGIRIESVVEILKMQKVYEVPELEDFIAGVIDVRGAVIPLVDMRKRFSLTSVATKERVVLVRFGRERLGLIVDEVREIVDFEDAELTKPPSIFKGLASEYLEGLGKKGEMVAILLNLQTLLSAQERLKLLESRQAMKEVG